MAWAVEITLRFRQTETDPVRSCAAAAARNTHHALNIQPTPAGVARVQAAIDSSSSKASRVVLHAAGGGDGESASLLARRLNLCIYIQVVGGEVNRLGVWFSRTSDSTTRIPYHHTTVAATFKIQVTGNNIEVTPAMRDYVQKKLGKVRNRWVGWLVGVDWPACRSMRAWGSEYELIGRSVVDWPTDRCVPGGYESTTHATLPPTNTSEHTTHTHMYGHMYIYISPLSI